MGMCSITMLTDLFSIPFVKILGMEFAFFTAAICRHNNFIEVSAMAPKYFSWTISIYSKCNFFAYYLLCVCLPLGQC